MRNIKYFVSLNSISPQTRSWGGNQFEDNATQVEYKLDEELSAAISMMTNVSIRIDFNSAQAGYDPSPSLSADSICRKIPYKYTRHGGEMEATLVITELDQNNNEVRTILSKTATIYFSAVNRGKEAEKMVYDSISALEKQILKNVEDGIYNGEDGKDGISVTHEWNGTVLTVTSASGTSSADLKGEKGDKGDDAIIDITYDAESENAQSGKAVAEALNSQYIGKNINLMSVYDKQEGLISSPSGTTLPFYSNASWWTVTIPLNADEYEKYYIATTHKTGTSLRYAFLDENKNYIADTYYAGSVPNGKPKEIDATLCKYIVISTAKNAFEQLTLAGGKVLSGNPYYELPNDVVPNYNSFYEHIFDSPLNKALGKKLGVLGDSITEGAGVSGKKWWEYVAERYGFASTQSNAEAGRAFARDGSESTRFTVRVTELDADCDVIIVFGGVNDFAFATPIGTIDDVSSNDNNIYADSTDRVTFYSSVRFVMEYLTTNFANSKIIFFTPLPKNNKETFNPTNAAGHKLNDYVEALKIMARTYGIDLVDTNAVGEFYVFNTNWLATYMPDGIHPNDAGTEVYVKNAIFPSLDKLLVNV